MRRLIFAIVLSAVVTPPVLAQDPPMMQRRDQLQRQVMQRFMQNVREQAGLTDEQAEQLQNLTVQYFQRRNELRDRERAMWMALAGQMRPGIAADRDSVVALLDGLIEVQEARVQLARQEQAEFAEFLSPVQRAQLMIAWRRLQMQIENVRGHMMQMQQGPPRRPM